VFIALVALVNKGLWLISIDGEALTLQRLLGWVFAPIAWLMGVPWVDCPEVGNVLGSRTILNELIAFDELQAVGPMIEPRSSAIAVFAVCGFANISSIGIQIGGLGALAPERRADIAQLGVRALIAATLANFSTACVAGALLE
jgi:CNT family concentrative nucleoside transporter